MMKFIHRLVRKKIVLFISDNASCAYYYDKDKLISSVFTNSFQEEQNSSKIATLLKKYPNISIYIIADISNQSFKEIKIPSTNPFIVRSILKRKLKKLYDDNDLHSYIKIKNKKNSSNFLIGSMFINEEPFSYWSEYLNKFDNKIDSFYSFPMEFKGLLNHLTKSQATKARWNIIVLQTKLGGVRMIINRDGDFVFSRYLDLLSDDSEISEVLELNKQISGTIEFLRRIDFNDGDKIALYFIIDKQLENVVKIENPITKSYYLSCNDVFKDFSKTQESRNDIITNLSLFFIKKGNFLTFLSKPLKKARFFTYSNLALNCLNVLLIITLLIFGISTIFHTIKSNNLVDNYNIQSKKLHKSLSTEKKKIANYDIEETKVIETARLHILMTETKVVEFVPQIIKLSSVIPKNIKVTMFNWKVNNKKAVYSLDIKALFSGKNLNYETLFSKYDDFIKTLEETFSKLKITHSGLPDKMNFSSKIDDISINFKLTGDIDD